MLELLRQQAIKRGLVDEASSLDAEAVFALVRDMPYQRASSREPTVTIQEWQGTCSGKHYLLETLFEELGFETRIVMCTHTFTEQNTLNFPEGIRRHLSAGPVPDVHTFIRLKDAGKWVDIDATWPMHTKRLGMRVNERFEPGINMEIACEPIDFFEVPN